MIDFDKMFTDFAMAWHKENIKKFSPAQIENMVDELYNLWADTHSADINTTPRRYFADISDTAELVRLLAEYCRCAFSPPTLLMDEVVSRPESAEYLLDEVRSGGFDEFTLICANLLLEQGNEKLPSLVIDWIFDSGVDEEFREVAADIVRESDTDFSEVLIAALDGDDKCVELAIDVLVDLPYDERVYKKLIDLFVNGDNIQLYASYLGKYGNPAALNILLAYAEDCNYMEFLEIRNAVEKLGGDFNVNRDFSDDEFYQIVKNIDGDLLN